ncbi:MAG TPA: glycoside hydrolase family 18 protein [Chitinophagaceae bacterium]|nr:glycoside hydrolase family 18 protein [Chitinophagaceae bacterium]
MKKLFILFAIPICFACYILPVHANGDNRVHAPETTVLHTAPWILSNDSVPKVNLLKKIGNVLKFRKNIRAAEQKRILDVINGTFLQDSIMANADEIRKLNIALSDTVNQRFDSLVSLINAIKVSAGKTDTLSPMDTTGAANDTAINKGISELLDKILPLLKEKVGDSTGVGAGLDLLKNIRYFYGRERKPLDVCDIPGFMKLQLTRKAAIFSFYPSGTGGDYLDYNFGIISTLVYDGFELDGRTGYCSDRGGTGSAQALKSAEAAGCQVLLSITDKNPANTPGFLNDAGRRQIFIDSVRGLLHERGADGINIKFDGLNNSSREDFVSFIRSLSEALKSDSTGYILTLTVPPVDERSAYDINGLNPWVHRFLIDFSANRPGKSAGPQAPLKGERASSIESTISRYLNANVSHTKFVVCLPYYGSEWKVRRGGGEDQFMGYLSLNDIATKFRKPVLYDSQTFTAFINLTNDKKQLTGQIWFDDSKTLDAIYDFIIQNDLGGIAVEPLGKNIGYSDVWTGIGTKFLSFDTVRIMGLSIAPITRYMDSIKAENFDTSWHYFKTYDSLPGKILFMFEHPCANLFPHRADRNSQAEFFRILRVTRYGVAAVSIIFLLIFLTTGYLYINQLRKKGKSWKFRKIMGAVLLLIVALMILFVFMFLFLSDILPGFGASGFNHTCYDMPLQTLLLVIISGIALGIAIMRFLIFPLIKKEDIP